ncbi:PREDICTED: protein FAM19A5 [Odobenus rosmarus divergens]|uniref:Protein FAM19A5 n=1 Tax=Odobenus rosmarus divergens TaxID=9708 RepID=A0A2U3WRN3_ODORO|nr:PREDICTED: protein FAM19A5 [Odobenus rosmarus divergens]
MAPSPRTSSRQDATALPSMSSTFWAFMILASLLIAYCSQLAAGTCEIVTLDRDSSQPRRTIARQTARCACRKGQIAGTTRARPACVDARIIKTKQWCDMLPCLEGEGCDLLINRSGWTCTQPGGRIKTTTGALAGRPAMCPGGLAPTAAEESTVWAPRGHILRTGRLFVGIRWFCIDGRCELLRPRAACASGDQDAMIGSRFATLCNAPVPGADMQEEGHLWPCVPGPERVGPQVLDPERCAQSARP